MIEDEQHALSALRELIQVRYDDEDWMTWKEETPRLTQALRALSLEEARQLGEELWARPDREELRWFLGQLNAAVPRSLTGLMSAFLAGDVFVPGWLYLGAPTPTTSEVLRQLDESAGAEDTNDLRLNGLLTALAWLDDDLVRAHFRHWRANPPGWRSTLYIPPEDYAMCAGWELTPDGERRQLYRSTSYELVPMEAAEYLPGAVEVQTPHEGTCGWCGRTLITLLDIDLRDLRCRFIAGDGTEEASRLRIAHCWWCSTYTTLYTDIDLTGKSVWSAANEAKPTIFDTLGTGEGEELADLGTRRLILGTQRRTPFEALGRFMLDETGISQLGGHPEWIQNTQYPICPICQREMECIGQVSWDDLDAFAEGCTYAFMCLPCGKAATVYQQT